MIYVELVTKKFNVLKPEDASSHPTQVEYFNHSYNLSVESYWSLNYETVAYMEKTTKLVSLHL